MFQGFEMWKVVWFVPTMAIALTFLVISWRQPSATTINIRSSTTAVSESLFPPLRLKEKLAPVKSAARTSPSPTQEKGQSFMRTAQKHLPQTSVKVKTDVRPYTTPAIEIRVAIAQNISRIAIASSTEANIIDGSGQVLEPLLSNPKHFTSMPATQASYFKIGDRVVASALRNRRRHFGLSHLMVERYSSGIAGTEVSYY